MSSIRPIQKQDIPALKTVLDSIDLFPSEMLEDMTTDYFNNAESQDFWFTYTDQDQAVAIAYCAPEPLTYGTYNLYAIGVHKTHQSKGIGGKMMQYIEQKLRNQGNRILIVETSGSEALEGTRAFYNKKQYTQEATIRDFWDEGDDKVIFWKKL